MKLYTSYYYQLRFFPSNLIGLSTAVWPPKYIKLGEPDKRNVLCINCPPLRPGASCNNLCRGACEPKHPQNCTFLQEYRKQLDAIDFNNFMMHLHILANKIGNDINFAFIVYETPQNPCSERIVIQQWIRDHDLSIEEWRPNI